MSQEQRAAIFLQLSYKCLSPLTDLIHLELFTAFDAMDYSLLLHTFPAIDPVVCVFP